MERARQGVLSVIWLGGTGAVFLGLIPALSRLLEISLERTLGYAFILLGLSVFYFGLLRPGWFSKKLFSFRQQPPAKESLKERGLSNSSKAWYGGILLALADESEFWPLFPFALFFTVGGLAYLRYPTPSSFLLALICAFWVRLIYKIV